MRVLKGVRGHVPLSTMCVRGCMSSGHNTELVWFTCPPAHGRAREALVLLWTGRCTWAVHVRH